MNRELPILYSRGSTGKVLVWSIKVRETLEGVIVTTEHGEYYGKKSPTSYTITGGKNIGKSNETTSTQQALSEAESSWNRQKKKGYKSLIDLKITIPYDENYDTSLYHALDQKLPKYKTDKNNVVKPMLCQQYYRSKKNWIDPEGEYWDDRKYYYLMNPGVDKEPKSIIIDFPCIAQPKINGVRCLSHITRNLVKQVSREGDEINIPHIVEELETLSNTILDLFGKEKIILDGELYIHKRKLQDINSCIKKPNLDTYSLTYEVFDIAIDNNINSKRIQALSLLRDKIENSVFKMNCIRIVPSIIIENDHQAQYETDIWINQGFEGAIFRDINGLYEFGKRPKCITKLKRCISEDFIIVDIISQTKDPSKGLFVCRTEEGLEFEVNPKGTDDFKVLLLATKETYINKFLTCTFYEYTKDNKPFHIIYNVVKSE